MDADEQRRVHGALERVGDRHRDRLIGKQDPIVLQHLHDAVGRIEMRLAGQLQRVARRDHRDHARLFLRRAGVDVDDAAFGDVARHQHGVRRAGDGHLVRVVRGAGDFVAAVAPLDGIADVFHVATPAASDRARTTARFASSTLNALCLRGCAPSSALAAAFAKAALSAR